MANGTTGPLNHDAVFRPHRLLRTGHLQTWAGAFWPAGIATVDGMAYPVDVSDGDQVVVHVEEPPGLAMPRRTVLLVHGLGGSHQSPYIVRIARKLRAVGFRTARLDQRGCGAAFLLSRLPYHSGRSDDVRAAIEFLSTKYSDGPISLVGFSLGANLTLKLVGELGSNVCGRLDSAVAVAPPIDLAVCVKGLRRGWARIYDQYFVARLTKQIRRRQRLRPDAAGLPPGARPTSLHDLDDCFTAPVSGLVDAEGLYRYASCGQYIAGIECPTLAIMANDDPIIPGHLAETVDWPSAVQLRREDFGGHLGFVGGRSNDPDRFWIDWRILDWINHRTPRLSS